MSAQQTQEVISDELLRIHRETHGSGASRAHSYVRPNEQFLISEGHEEMVLDMRRTYQTAVSAAFSAAVERATGRRVTHFTSDTSLDPSFSVEVFKLA